MTQLTVERERQREMDSPCSRIFISGPLFFLPAERPAGPKNDRNRICRFSNASVGSICAIGWRLPGMDGDAGRVGCEDGPRRTTQNYESTGQATNSLSAFALACFG